MKNKLKNSEPRRKDAFKLEALEPRLLFSADAVSLIATTDILAHREAPFLETLSAADARASSSQLAAASSSEASATNGTEVVIIDRGVENSEWIAQQLSVDGNKDRYVHFIDSRADGVDQITAVLDQYENVSSVLLFSHGSDAQLRLGHTTLDMNELLQRAEQVNQWSTSLSQGADILIYGCDLASSDEGQAFATLLGELTRADIAASEDLSGNEELGGNWKLEFRAGSIEAETATTATALQDYSSVLKDIKVKNLDDDGKDSLREAIDEANLSGEPNVIIFEVSGTITLTSELPAFSSQVSMDGGNNIILDGSGILTGTNSGLRLETGSDNSIISNLQIINFSGDGIALNDSWYVTLTNNHIGSLIGADGTEDNGNAGSGISLYQSSYINIGDGTFANANVISGNGLHGITIVGSTSIANIIDYNFIGTNDDGTAAMGNGGTGINMEESASSNIIRANTISGNTMHGVSISGSDAVSNILTSNMIGTTTDGLTALGNGEDGVRLELGAYSNNIGSDHAGSANVISGNGNDGISISGETATNNLVLGNLIGTNVNGDSAIANGRHGVLLYNGAQNNEIGGSGDYESNIISGNTGNGITIDGESGTTTSGNLVLGNHIGTDITATLAIGNTGAGIDIVNGASNSRIGGDRSSAQTNVIVANEFGIKLGSTGTDGNTILGNYIGTNSADSTSLGNTSDGINIWGGASNTVIGGTGNAEGNIISGNGADGVSITGDDSDGTVIKANLIGTNSAGSSALGNGNNGVGFYSGASNSTLGGDSSAGEGNLISGNLSNGVELWGAGTEGNRISGNQIGTNLDGSGAVENGSNGVEIADGASHNIIGGNFNDNTGNLISGNGNAGILVFGSSSNGNIITGNRIGTDATGDAKLQNLFGIYQSAATDTQIGSSVAGEGNIISGNVLSGIRFVTNSSTATIQGNYVGTDALGSLLIGNGTHGIDFTNSTAGITIGGENAGEGNIISGNARYGIRLLNTTDVDMKGNHIGVDESGFVDIGNSLGGIFLEGSTSNTLIGGSLAGESNIISGNDGDGIVLGASAENNTITGNTIGLAVNELALLGNAGHGVLVLSSNNRIGGSSTNERNIIAANTGSGIHVDSGATGNALLGNSIWQNGSIGIDLGGEGNTDNDVDDVDTGANNLQNFPELTEVATDESGTLGIEGLLQSSANTTFRIEFFTSTTLDASGHGDARELVGYTTVTTDTSGTANFQALLNAIVSGSDYVTATATVDNGSSGFSDTSEYSASVIADSSGSTSNAAPEFSLGSGYHQVDLGAFSSDAVDMATQSDGRYLVLSKANSPASSGKYDFVLTRFNADGSLDSSFGTDGTVISSGMSANYEFAKALSVQSDGKIIVAGNRDLGGHDEAIMYRYNADGSLDTSFGTAGEANFSIPGTDHTALRDITLMTDGRIVGTGFVTVGGEDSMVIIRTTASGSLDTSFNGSGYRIIDTGAGDAVGMAVQIQTDDKIVLVGQRYNGSTYESRIVRLNVDGTLDTTFDGDGHRVLVSTDNLSPTTVAITDDGKIVIGGHSDASGEPSQIVRLLTDGSLDSSFGGSGYVTVNAGDAAETVTRLVIDLDGRLVVVGDVFNGSNNDISIFRLNTDGSLDTTLGGNGLVRIDLSGADDIADAVVVDANGNIKIAGEADDQTFIASILENGVLDTRFNVSNSLTGTADYTENTAAIVLDANVTVYDRELSAADNFSGASLTLVRDSAADGDDVFGFVDDNDLSLTGGQIFKNGLAIATFDISSLSGQLSITFTDANGEVPGNADVNHTLQQITYLNANDNPPAQVQLNWTLTDGDSGDDLSVIEQTTVSLTASNDAPEFDTTSTLPDAEEDTDYSVTINTSDPDVGDTRTLTATGLPGWLTMQDNNDGTATLSGTPLQGDIGSVSFTLEVEDATGLKSTRAFSFTVQSVNDASEFTSGRTFTVDENATIAAQITSSDEEGHDPEYAIFGGNDAALFSIDADSGVLTFNSKPDFENPGDTNDDNVYEVAISVTDNVGPPYNLTVDTVTITVRDLADENLSPITDQDTIASDGGIVDENSAIGTMVGITANSVDGDSGQIVSYALSGTDASLFSIDADGIITTAAVLDHETADEHSFTVTATSSDGSTATRDFTVSVTNLPDEDLSPITDTDPTAGSDGIIAENSAIGSTVGITANSVDGDAGQTVSYALSGTDAALFSIDGSGIVTTAAVLDHENADEHSFTVTATSSDGSTATSDFTVTITDLADEDLSPITDLDTIAGSEGILDENSAIGSTVGITANSVDGDAGQTVSYALSGTDAALFSIDTNGIVTSAAVLDHEDADERNFTVSATSSDGSTATRDFTVTVTDLADEDLSPITDTDPTAGNDGVIDENSAIGSIVGIQANTVDGDDGQTITYALSGTDAALFSIDTNGIVTTAVSLDHEAADQHSFTVTATSSDGSTATRDFTVSVTDLPDEDLSPITDLDTTAGSDGIIDENSAIGSNVGIQANTVDGDDGQTITYALSGTDAALFSIDGIGIVTTAASLDHEAADQRSFTVTATSSDGSIITRDFTVTVTDLADEDLSPITDLDTTAGSEGIIDENSAIGSNVRIQANTVDGDDGQTITYALSGTDAALFSIDGSGIVTTAAVLDHENADEHSFTVTATSSDGSTATRDFTVSVTDLPDEDLSPITDTDPTAGSEGIIDEDSAIGSTVGIQANTVDGDAGQSISYALSGNDAALFSIDTNGIVTTAAVLDHEAADQRSFTVTATSTDGSTATRDFTVTVTDLPDEDLSPITDLDTIADSEGIIDENSAIGSHVGIQANTVDGDDGQTITYALSGTDAALFSIDTNGIVSTAASLDHEAADQRSFTVTATSSDGSTATRSFTVSVTDLPDEDLSPITDTDPTAGSDGIIDENSAIGSTVGIIANSVDGDAGQTVSYALSGTDAALFNIDANGMVTTAAVLDHEVADQYRFTVTATSSDGSTANHSFTVIIADLNEEPVFTTSATLPDAIEDVLYTTMISTFDADTNDSVTFNNAVIPAWLSLIDNGDGTVTFRGTPEHIHVGSHEITLEIEDSAGLKSTRTFSLTVGGVNDAPVISSGSEFAVAENSSNITTVTASDADGDALSFAIYGGNDAALFTIDSMTGELAFSSTPDFENPQDANADQVYDLIIGVDDGTGSVNAVATQAMTITVTDLPDEDLIPITDLDIAAGSDGIVNENSVIGSTVGITANTVDGDNGQAIAYTLGGADAALFRIDADGVITTNATLNHETASQRSFTVTATSSDGSTASRSFTVTINDLNEAPVFVTDSSLPDASEDKPYTVIISASDPDSGDIHTFKSTDLPDWLTMVDNMNGTVTLNGTPQQSNIGPGGFTLTIEDADGLKSTRIFSLTVTSENDAPVITSDSAFAVTENTGDISTVTATDVDGDTLTYAIAGGSDAALFTVDPVTGALGFAISPDYENTQDSNSDNVYELLVSVNDGSDSLNALTTQSVIVTVTDLADEDLSPITDLDTIAGSDGTVEENGAIGIRVGITANSVDGDTGQTISYTLSGNDAALFNIDNDGVITTASVLNHEASRQHNFTVTATSSDGSSIARDFFVDVTDINEPPAFTSASVITVPENTRLVTTITATDVDGDTLTYTIVGGRDSSVFTINTETGDLNFIRSPDFESPIDSNQDNQYQVVVAANGSGRLQTTQELLVNVSNVNESPAISTTQIQSTPDHNGNIGTLNISDPDSGDIVELRIVGGAAASSFTYDTSTDQLSQVNHLEKGTYTLEVVLIDSSGNSTQATLTITILADPLLQAAQPDITVGTDTLEELETATESNLEPAYNRISELPELSSTQGEVQEQVETLQQSNDVKVEKTTGDDLHIVDPWNESMLDEMSADSLADDNSPALAAQSTDNAASGSQSESGEKNRLLALLDGLQARSLVIAPSILQQFQILPFQLSLAPSMQDGSDKLTQELAETVREQNEQQQLVVAIGTGASVALTAGFVSWLLKAGVLVSTAKSSAPLWGAIDPVPVLHRRNIV